MPRPPRYLPSFRGIGEASVIAAAESAMQDLAEKIAAKAKALAIEEGLQSFADSIKVETSTRPKGRGQVQVIAYDENAQAVEFGDGGDTERRRILGRAAGVQINLLGDGDKG